MGGLEEAIEQLKSEGYSSEDIQKLILHIKKTTGMEPIIIGSLDGYLDSLEDEEEVDELL